MAFSFLKIIEAKKKKELRKERNVFCLASLKYHWAPTGLYFLTVTMPRGSEGVEVFKMRFKLVYLHSFQFLTVLLVLVQHCEA